MLKKIYYYTALISCLPTMSFAYGTADSIGEALENTGDNIIPALDLLEIMAYIIGITLGIMGVIKLKEYLDAGGKMSLKDPVSRIMMGAFLIALPSIIRIILASTIGNDGGELGITDMDI